MAIQPDIALGYRPPQINVDIQTPIQRFATVMSLRDMMTRQQMGQMQLQEAGLQLQRAQQEQRERQAIADWYKQQTVPDASAPGTPGVQPWELTPEKIAQLHSIAPNLAPGLIKQNLDTTEAFYKGQHEKATSGIDQLNRVSAIAQGIVDERSKLAGIATLFNEGHIKSQERDYLNGLAVDSPQFQNVLKSYEQAAPNGIAFLNQQREQAQLKIAQADEARKAAKAPFELTEAQQNAQKATLEAAAAQKSQDASVLAAAFLRGSKAYSAALEKLPEDRQSPFPLAPKGTAEILTAGLKTSEAVTAAQAAANAAQTAKHETATEAIERGQLSVAQRRESREQNIYNQTYGPGANPALVGVEPRLRTAATAAAQKAADENVKAQRTADAMENFIALARQGNKAAYANMPVAGVLDITTSAGNTTRINRNELEAYSGAGSLLDKLKGKIGGVVSGAKIPKDVLDDIEQLHKSIRQGADNAYNQKLDGINQNYHANFKPIPKAGGAGVPDAVKSLLSSNDVVPGVHTLSDGTKWLKAADGSITRQ